MPFRKVFKYLFHILFVLFKMYSVSLMYQYETMIIQRKEISEAITYKMFEVMTEQKKKLGLRYFANEIGVSLATLARLINIANEIDLKTLMLVCEWLKCPLTDFVQEEK